MRIRAIRGATTANCNSSKSIIDATAEMMKTIIRLNGIVEEDVISIIFTATKDLDQEYPSVAIRKIIGWNETPILNFEEKYVQNSLSMCIRVLIQIHSTKEKSEINHVYLKNAANLRPDLVNLRERK